MSRARKIEGIELRLQSIAFDVGQHFAANFKGTGLKGQLAASSKRAAIQLKKLFDIVWRCDNRSRDLRTGNARKRGRGR